MLNLSPEFRDNLFTTLLAINALQMPENRNLLLRNLPKGPVSTINRSNAPMADLNSIVTAVESWGRLNSGEWALVVLANNALLLAQGTEQEKKLKNLLTQLEEYAVITADLPEPIPAEVLQEVVIGTDERVSVHFLANGLIASKSVAKVLVPRVKDGKPENKSFSGTGWLIAPGLLLTNYHVIEARDRRRGEPPATESDFRAQAMKASAWFNYIDENDEYWDYQVTELLNFDTTLDYALLRLSSQPISSSDKPLSYWGYLSIPQSIPTLIKGDRLNIIQHPLGGYQKIAIRSNFYVDSVSTSSSPHRIRYLTDTEPGSSGSPVFNDYWNVVALHHASVEVPETSYKGQTTKHNNQGILIHSILEHLSSAVKDEILVAQTQRAKPQPLS